MGGDTQATMLRAVVVAQLAEQSILTPEVPGLNSAISNFDKNIYCEFYKKCWINKGLNKIPKVYTNTSLKLNLSRKDNIMISDNLFLKIQ